MDVSSGGVGEVAAVVGPSPLFRTRSFPEKTHTTIHLIAQKWKRRRSSTQSEPKYGIRFAQYLLYTTKKFKRLVTDLTKKRCSQTSYSQSSKVIPVPAKNCRLGICSSPFCALGLASHQSRCSSTAPHPGIRPVF